MKASGYNRYLGISPVEEMQKSADILKKIVFWDGSPNA